MFLTARASQTLLAIALFMAGAGLAVWAAGESRRSGRLPQFYQDEFAPAVMLACGHGYQNVEWRGTGPLADFLLQKADSVSCQTLSQNVIVPLDAFQRISLYLEYSVAGAWKLFGPSWRAVRALYAILGGLVAVVLYGIMRLGLNSPVASAATLMTLTSPLHLTYVPELRDYSKVPFLLALVLIMGLMVKHFTTATRLVSLTAIGGIVAGIGFGFRTDVVILALPFVLSVLCFRRAAEASRWLHVAVGVRGVAVFAVAFVAVAWPIIRGYSKGSNTAHVALLGLSTHFDAPLGVETRHYELSPLYLDAYEEAVVREYARRTTAEPSFFLLGSEEYDRQSARYLGQIVATLPADMMIRAIAASIKAIDIGFTDAYVGVPSWLQNPVAVRAYELRKRAVASVPGLGLMAAGLVALGLLCADLRMGLFFVFLTTFMTASAALQFLERHVFYLEFIGWWVVAFAGAEALKMISAGVLRRTRPHWFTLPKLSRAVVAVAAVSIAGGSTVWGARVYQQGAVNRLFAQYLNTPSTELPITTTAGADGKLLLAPAISDLDLDQLDQPEELTPRVRAEHLKLELNPSLCDSLVFDATIRYAASSPAVDFSHQIKVPLSSAAAGPTMVVVPVFVTYFTRSHVPMSSKFEGIEVAPNQVSCLSAIRRVSDRHAFTLLMMAILPSDWSAAGHYQTLVDVERRYDGAPWTTDVYSTAPTGNLNRALLNRPVDSIAAATSYRFPQVRFVGRFGVEMAGRAETPYAYLLETASRLLPGGRFAIAEGDVSSGGLTFGLLRSQVWYQQVHIRAPGRFVAVAQTLEEGSFSIVLANENDGLFRRTSFHIDRIGWIGD